MLLKNVFFCADCGTLIFIVVLYANKEISKQQTDLIILQSI